MHASRPDAATSQGQGGRPASLDCGVGDAELERRVADVEASLAQLQSALRGQDAAALEDASNRLRLAMAGSVEGFRMAARRAPVPTAMRERLARASARIAAQREALARATASLDRAIEVLLPQSPSGYGASGRTERRGTQGWIQA